MDSFKVPTTDDRMMADPVNDPVDVSSEVTTKKPKENKSSVKLAKHYKFGPPFLKMNRRTDIVSKEQGWTLVLITKEKSKIRPL